MARPVSIIFNSLWFDYLTGNNKNMKSFISAITILLLTACNQPDVSIKSMQAQIDSLQLKIKSTYKPGLGEFMLDFQMHHAKLWFAGQAGNWRLSDFETKEIRESLEDIQNYCSDRPEVAFISMINPALDSVDKAISHKNIAQFSGSFNLLTTTCNNCHRIIKHEFNVIQIPTAPPFTNQVFKLSSEDSDSKH